MSAVPSVRRRIVQALIQAALVVLLLVLVAVLLSGPSQAERHQTATDVARLVDEARITREVICRAVLFNPANAASADPVIIDICAEIGVEPEGG